MVFSAISRMYTAPALSCGTNSDDRVAEHGDRWKFLAESGKFFPIRQRGRRITISGRESLIPVRPGGQRSAIQTQGGTMINHKKAAFAIGTGRQLLLPALACLLIAGCNIGERGNGVKATEVREVGDFEKVAAKGVANVVITVGQPKSVTVTVDENLMELVETEVKDHQLVISTSRSISTGIGLNVEITVPTLTEAGVSGVGDITVNDASGATLQLRVSGAGNIRASGTVGNVEARVSGVGDVELRELNAENVKVSVSGSGGAQVYASKSVDATVSGVGGIDIYGNPEIRKHSTSGVGSITFK
jgi:hypothetical protein